jgi:hypothetical protein
METLQPLLNLLGGDHGRLAQVIALIGSARIALKPFNLWLQAQLTALVDSCQDRTDFARPDHVRALLESTPYRLLAFAVDLLSSIKLPDASALTVHRSDQ